MGVLKSFDLISYSKKVGNNFTGIKDNLSNSLSLYKTYHYATSKTVFSEELIDADIYDMDEKAGKVNLG